MRPVPTPAEGARSMARAGEADVLSSRGLGTPMTPLSCFITTEAELESSAASPDLRTRTSVRARKRSRSSSLSLSDRSGHRRRQASPSLSSDADHGISEPLTPNFTGAKGPGSSVSVSSSAAVSSNVSLSEEPNSIGGSSVDLPPSRSRSTATDNGGAAGVGPQLVMPSLTVPRRRPFSDVGKTLGKLKVLVTGQAGIGKTSLVFTVARCCEHIVHVDSMGPAVADRVAEIHASTRPHPWWRADLNYATCARRGRMSWTTEEILDRNLCFVDCSVPRDTATASRPDVRYVESWLARLRDKPMDDADLCSLVSNGSESIVDVVLYMLPHSGPDSNDVETVIRLQELTNVIPLLARADELSSEGIEVAKERLRELLGDVLSGCFSFASPECPLGSTRIYSVSSATHSDPETIDASVLMSSDYMPPLVHTDLEDLVERIFSPDGTCWLRHSAALKLVDWRRRQFQNMSMRSALTCRCLSSDGALVPYAAASPGVTRSYWGRIEFSSWAEGLRQSLAAERLGQSARVAGHELLACGMPLTKSRAGGRRKKAHHQPAVPTTSANHQDPLGLLQLTSQIRHSGGLTLELLSSLGVVGCLAVWFIRPELTHHWDVKLASPWRMGTCC